MRGRPAKSEGSRMLAITVSHGSPAAAAISRTADVLPLPGPPQRSTGTRTAIATPSELRVGRVIGLLSRQLQDDCDTNRTETRVVPTATGETNKFTTAEPPASTVVPDVELLAPSTVISTVVITRSLAPAVTRYAAEPTRSIPNSIFAPSSAPVVS